MVWFYLECTKYCLLFQNIGIYWPDQLNAVKEYGPFRVTKKSDTEEDDFKRIDLSCCKEEDEKVLVIPYTYFVVNCLNFVTDAKENKLKIKLFAGREEAQIVSVHILGRFLHGAFLRSEVPKVDQCCGVAS